MSTTIKDTVIPLYFNSRDRINISDSTTDYTIRLRKDLRNISSISVSNVGIPRTYTNINRNNNNFVIIFSTEGDVNLSTVFTIEIANRNYTGAELQTALQNAFDVSQESISIGLTWIVTYDTNTEFYGFSVQYDPGASITWGISFTYTALVDTVGIGDGGTTANSYLYSATNTDTLVIPVNRKATLFNNLHFNITSEALTNDINTSYVTSLAKSFNINASNNQVVLDTIQTLTKYTSQLALGTGSIGDVSFGFSISLSGDGQTIISGAPNDDGFKGAIYTYIRQDTGTDYFQTPVNNKTQTSQFLSANGQEGFATALSTDARTMVVGAPGDDWVLLIGRTQGAAHIYTWTGTQWVQRFKITPTAPGKPQDQQLGTQVAISGDGLTVAASGLVETVLYKNTDNIWDLSGRFAFSTDPQLNSDGTILTLYNAGNIEIWTLSISTWVLTQVINHDFPVVDMSDDGTLLVTSGLGSVNVYINTGTYVLDGAPLSQTTSQFGVSATISGDGTRIAVGDPLDNPGDVWVYTKAGSWILEQQLTHTATSVTDPNIGGRVKLSTDGETLVTSGASADSNTGSLWVWRYNTIDNIWEPVDTSNPIRPIGFSSDTDQGYSSSIAHGGSVFVTGGPLDNSLQGAVWVYRRDRFLWNQEGEKLVATDLSADSFARFGHSVAISGDGTTFAVGAIRDFGGGTSNVDDTGATWIYRYDADTNTWTQQGNKIFGSPFVADQFQGSSVSLSIDGNVLAVGAPRSTVPTSGNGTVFIFTWDGSIWSQQGSALQHTGLSVSSANGWSVSLNTAGDILVTGAPADNAVSVFTRSGTAWTETASLLTGTGGAATASYGQSVSISPDGSTIAVGAPGLNPGDQGYVEIWTQVNSIWTLQRAITETPFAGSVDLSFDGNVLCVGALDSPTQVDITSKSYVYTRTSGVWTQFDNPVVGERRTNTEDYQGFSSSVEYIDDSDDFIMIVGGIGFGAFQGGNWSYISNGTFDTKESYTIPTRAYTIFDLINVLNAGLSAPVNLDFIYTFNEITNTVAVTTHPEANVSAVVAINSTDNTFDIFGFKGDSFAASHESDELDFSINNNVVKSINTSSTTFRIYDTEPNLVFRKYEAGYTIPSTGVIDIQLRDERDRVVDLYGADWIMVAYATIHN